MDHPPLSHHPHRRLYSPLPDIAPAPFAPSLFEFIYETSWEEMEDSSDKMAILDASTGQSRTFAECYQTATGLAGALKYDYHVSTSSCVAVVCPNHVDYLSIALAVSLCGAMLTTVDSQCSLQELEHVLKQSQASVLVVHASLMEIAKQVVDALTNSVKHCIVVTDGYFEPELVPKAMVSLDKLRHHNKAFFRSDNSNYKDCDQSPYLVTFPSESSIPVILTQGNLIASMLQLKQVDELNEQVDETSSSSSFMNHKVLSPLPFSDVYGFTVSLLYAAWTGQTLVTM